MEENNQIFIAVCGPASSVKNLTQLKVELVDLGFRPVSYAGLNISLKASSLDAEFRDDFYGSKAIFVYFCEELNNAGETVRWIISETKHAISRGARCAVFCDKELNVDRIWEKVSGIEDYSSRESPVSEIIKEYALLIKTGKI